MTEARSNEGKQGRVGLGQVRCALVPFRRKWLLDHNLGTVLIHCYKVAIASKPFHLTGCFPLF